MHDVAQGGAHDARRAVPAPMAGEARPAAPSRSRRRRLLLAAAVAVYAIALAEIGSRAFWRWQHGVPLLEPGQIASRVFYPELRQVEHPGPPGSFTVLFLGGSVVADTDPYNRIPSRLAERLSSAARRPVVVHGLAQAGHGTRDSLLKYRALADRRFDLVVVYHGINDARANNAPPEVFRPDYSHYAWYAQVNAFARHAEVRWLVLPFTVEWAALRAHESWRPEAYVPRHIPRADWLEHGDDLRTPAPFRENLGGILDLAAERGEPVLLMSFAWYLPADYSLERMRAGRLDYSEPLLPLEAWGKPENVARALAAHNAVVRDVAAERPEVLFVDQESLVPRDGRHFRDVCHLSPLGADLFVDNLERAILPLVSGAGRGAGARSPGAGSPTSRP